jgi:hypothetical protein
MKSAALILLILLLSSFQNCSPVSHTGVSSPSVSTTPAPVPQASSSGGTGNSEGYDGKLFVDFRSDGAKCLDGSKERGRIYYDETKLEATLVRENCANVTPRVLAPNTYSFTRSGVAILYGNHAYQEHLPAQPDPASVIAVICDVLPIIQPMQVEVRLVSSNSSYTARIVQPNYDSGTFMVTKQGVDYVGISPQGVNLNLVISSSQFEANFNNTNPNVGILLAPMTCRQY